MFFATVEPRDASISTTKIAHPARHFLSTYTQRNAQQYNTAASDEFKRAFSVVLFAFRIACKPVGAAEALMTMNVPACEAAAQSGPNCAQGAPQILVVIIMMQIDYKTSLLRRCRTAERYYRGGIIYFAGSFFPASSPASTRVGVLHVAAQNLQYKSHIRKQNIAAL